MKNTPRILLLAKRITDILRITLLLIVLCVVIVGAVGFLFKWGPEVWVPQTFLTNYREVTEDIFSILVAFEVLDLLRTKSPTRLTDIVLLVIARKIVLSTQQDHLLLEAVSFAVVLLVRFMLSRKTENTYD